MINQNVVTQGDILAAMKRGVIVITGNKRLASVTREKFETAVAAAGEEVWVSPSVLPWSVWLKNSWEELVLSGALPADQLLLSAQQELYLWQEIVTSSMVHSPLQQVSNTAKTARDAWELMQLWQLPLDAGVFQYNSDSAGFLRWAIEFDTRCLKNAWVASVKLAELLAQAINNGYRFSNSELMLFGFDALTPRQQTLFKALGDAGCELSWVTLDARDSQAVRVSCRDERDEAKTAARWARACLERDPGTSIGIVVPELGAKRTMLVQALDEVLTPAHLLAGNPVGERPYNLSLGLPLSHYPVVRIALLLLGVNESSLALEDVCRLLGSPFVTGWEQEASARALLETRLRDCAELTLSLSTLRFHAAAKDKPHSCPLLVACIDSWRKQSRKLNANYSAGLWSEQFAGLLKAIGWGQGRTLSSEEYQASEAWQDLLIALATLESVANEMSRFEALAHLRKLASERVFQPQGGEHAIQLLGVLEANELQFDALWLLGLYDGVWPTQMKANPFIPMTLQRKVGLPHSSEARELQVARLTTQKLLASAKQVIVSYPLRKGDEELRASPLITDIAESILPPIQLWQTPLWKQQVHQNSELEVLAADPAPALDAELAKGGTSVFRNQALCPFRAFAEHRLNARDLNQVDVGLDPMVRGTLIHSVLEQVWNALGDQQTLINMLSSDLDVLIRSKTEAAIENISAQHSVTLATRFRTLEIERLCTRVRNWLELEKSRAPFRVVEHEKTCPLSAAGVTFNVKIDRIDELEGGDRVVIDYKTGKSSLSKWFGERPEEPQLPLYTVAMGSEIAGVTFAQVRAGEMAFKGVTADEDVFPGVKSFAKVKQTRDASGWDAVLAEWRATVDSLAKAYSEGDASVDPKKFPGTCESTYCKLRSLCRIDELRQFDEPGDGEGDGEGGW